MNVNIIIFPQLIHGSIEKVIAFHFDVNLAISCQFIFGSHISTLSLEGYVCIREDGRYNVTQLSETNAVISIISKQWSYFLNCSVTVLNDLVTEDTLTPMKDFSGVDTSGQGLFLSIS